MGRNILIWIFFLLLLVWKYIKVLKNYIRCVMFSAFLPGPEGLPFLGNILTLKNSDRLVDLGTNASQYFGRIFRAWVLFLPFVFVYEPDDLKIILSNSKASEKNFLYCIMHTFIGDGLITNNGGKWKQNRRLVQHYFQIHYIENYFDIFANISQEFTANLSTKKCVKITEFVNSLVLNILHKAVLGISSTDDNPFRRGELLILKRILKPWLLLETVFKHSDMSKRERRQNITLHQYVKKVLNERLCERKKKKIVTSPSLLDYFIELMETTRFSEKDVVNESVTFMLAGQDSVGATIAFTLYYLAKHQDIQEKLLKEITDVSPENVPYSLDQINRMTYLEQCIKETMRLAPSVPIISRVLTSDIVLDNYTLPAGLNVFISPFITHRLPHIFKNPLNYDPERFSSENLKKIPSHGFIPYSAGPRNCIGYKFAYLQMKTILATLIKNYRFKLIPGKENLSFKYRVTLRAKAGIFLEIVPRSKIYVD
ncbi:probable cytochrome P450 4aa1 [Sitophilus oryzae]|uniref:Probable cytochrome P450 4aa1 n=1 Tax=Sitophilus oryzae TaxID=7048 RepID=A0A6J2YSB6_SITOR|nr:probable cytochrome P450 4aa1 [Sitophilus oryzae]